MSAAFECYRCGLIGCTGEDCPQPTASVDAEQVWREALSAAAMSPRSRGASFDPDQAATAVIQAYGDARADAARREALEEAAMKADEAAAENDRWKSIGKWTAKSIATTIRALKENPNAG